MSQIIIIEQDPRYISTLQTMLKDIDKDAKFLVFSNMNQFIESYKQGMDAIKSGKTEKPKEESDGIDFLTLKLIVADIQLTQKIEMSLWHKFEEFTRSYQKKNGVKKTSVKFLYMGYDDNGGHFLPEKYCGKGIFNLIIKPFDALLVKQYLKMALTPDGPINIEDMYSQKTDSFIEIIKDINIELLTELGFRTSSNRPIETSKIARYYGSPFEGKESDSVFAYCYANYKHATNPPTYTCSFSYLGIPLEQLNAIRRTLKLNKKTIEHHFPSKETVLGSAIILSKDKELIERYSNLFHERFQCLDIFQFGSVLDLYDCLPPEKKATVDMGKKSELHPSNKNLVITFNKTFEKILAVELIDENKKRTSLKDFLGTQVSNFLNKVDEFRKFLDLDGVKQFGHIKNSKKKFSPSALTLISADKSLKYNTLVTSVTDEVNSNVEEVVEVTLHQMKDDEIFQYNKNNKNIPKNILFTLMDHRFFRSPQIPAVKNITKTLNSESASLPDPKVFFVSADSLRKYEDIEKFEGCDDIFNNPPDSFYLTRKLKMHCPSISLKDKNDNSRLGLESHDPIRTAQPVKVNAISEVHLSFTYHRELKIGEVRRFAMWLPGQKTMPAIFAVCRHCEKIDKESYRCDFMYFGIQDRQLKHIRQWIKFSYSSQEKK